MKIRRITLLTCIVAGLGLVAPSVPGVVGVAAADKKKKKRVKKKKVCSKNKKGKRRCRWVPINSGANATKDEIRDEPLPVPSGELAFTSPNFSEEFAADIFDDDGNFDDAALAVLDHGFRSRESGEERAVDPELYVLLSIIYDHFDKQPLELVSGFRYTERTTSRHYHASACDFRIPGEKINDVYAFVKTLDTGGIGLGLYPTSGFIHLDIRAPGAPSYRCTDYSGSKKSTKKKTKRKKKKATKKSKKKKKKTKTKTKTKTKKKAKKKKATKKK